MAAPFSTDQLYRSAFIWDAHSGVTPSPNFDLSQLAAWRAAGVSFLSINVGYDVFPWESTIKTLAAFRAWFKANSSDYLLVERMDDLNAATLRGRMAVSFDIEGLCALDGSLEMIELYYDLGVRQILLAYNRNNNGAGGCHDVDEGLSAFGRGAIDEMNRLGILVDLSHCGERTSLEAIEYSRAPPIFSHSNVRRLCDHERNLTDAQISACAKKGGVIGIVGLNRFLGAQNASIKEMADHIDYLIERVGARHVGIGLDYSFPASATATDARIKANPSFWPRGYDQFDSVYAPPSALPELAETLAKRGHDADVIRGVLGENFRRVAQVVWG